MEDNQYGDAPNELRFRDFLIGAMRVMDDAVNGKERPKKIAIVMMMFETGEPGPTKRTNYISNGVNREDMIRLLRDQADRFEEDLKISGGSQ